MTRELLASAVRTLKTHILLFILVHISRRWGPIIAPEAKTVVRLAVSDSVPAILSACSVGHVLTAQWQRV